MPTVEVQIPNDLGLTKKQVSDLQKSSKNNSSKR